VASEDAPAAVAAGVIRDAPGEAAVRAMGSDADDEVDDTVRGLYRFACLEKEVDAVGGVLVAGDGGIEAGKAAN